MNDATSQEQMTTSMLLLNRFRPFITGKVLDVGCGSQPYKKMFPDCEWVGMDNRPVGDVLADAKQPFPFEDESFDTVVCTNLLHLIEEPRIAVAECARVLKDGGCLIVTVRNTGPQEQDVCWGIKARGLDYLFYRAGLKGVDILYDGRQFTRAWDGFFGHYKYSAQLPADLDGFTGSLDRAFPVITAGVARKESPDGNDHPLD